VLVTLSEAAGEIASSERKLLALDAALVELARLSPRQAVMVEARFFGGLDMAETASMLNVSEATLLRDWRAAKAWLAHKVSELR
jgi:RNA polymerase sigma-70 factor (ECF subfamily)